MNPIFAIVYIFAILIFSVGILTNLYAFVKIVRQKGKIFRSIFPMIMIIADILCLINGLLFFKQFFQAITTSAVYCVLHRICAFGCYLVAYLSFYSYMFLRIFAIVWPIQCRLYLRHWHIYALAAFNVIYPLLSSVDEIFHYRHQMYSSNKTICSPKLESKTIGLFPITHLINEALTFFLFGATIVLVIMACYRLSRKSPTDFSGLIKMKQHAIQTICCCFLLFTICHVGVFVGTALIMVTHNFGVELPREILIYLYLLRMIGLAINPLLYYKTRDVANKTEKKVAFQHPSNQTSSTNSQ